MATLSQLINAKAIALGKLAVRATTAAGSGHPTSALALAHLTATLMYHTMRWRPEQPSDSAADRLVLSEGHAVPIIYAACADLGATFCPRGEAKRMTVDDLMTLREIDSAIDGHPNPALGFPFFDAATGSLGQGLSSRADSAALRASMASTKSSIASLATASHARGRSGRRWISSGTSASRTSSPCSTATNSAKATLSRASRIGRTCSERPKPSGGPL